MSYIELHAASAFSFLDGASLPEALIGACHEFEMPAMALLDRDGVYGAARFHLAGKKAGVRAHVGAEISMSIPDARFPCSLSIARDTKTSAAFSRRGSFVRPKEQQQFRRGSASLFRRPGLSDRR